MSNNNHLSKDYNPKLPSTIVALPYTHILQEVADVFFKDEEFNESLFSTYILKKAIENIKSSKIFSSVELEESEEFFKILSIKYDDDIYKVHLFNYDFDINSIFIDDDRLLKRELTELENLKIAIGTEIIFNDNIQKSYLFQLTLLNTLFSDICAIYDISSSSIYSGKWLNEITNFKAYPSPTSLFAIQAISGDNNDVWLHTHGLRRCGLCDLEILNLSDETYGLASHMLSYLALMLLHTNETEIYKPIQLGVDIVVTLVPSPIAIKKYSNIIGSNPYERNNHNDYYMTVFYYDSDIDISSQTLTDIAELIPTLDNPVFHLSTDETLRMADMAKKLFNSFLELTNNPRNMGCIKAGYALSDEFQNSDANLKEHLWFTFVEYKESNDTIKAILQNKPYYIKDLSVGDEVIFKIDDISNWMVYSSSITYNPNNAYLYEE